MQSPSSDVFHKWLLALIPAFIPASSTPWWLKDVVKLIKGYECHSVWLYAIEYQECFNKLSSTKYPTDVQGRLNQDQEHYRSKWLYAPAGVFCYVSCAALSEKQFQHIDATLKNINYTLKSENSFEGVGRLKKHQATWTSHVCDRSVSARICMAPEGP